MRIRLRRKSSKKSVLFVGQCYYHCWYLSRELRKLGWRADVLNWDPSEDNLGLYHGEDYRFTYSKRSARLRQLWFYVRAMARYDVFHFSNMHGLNFGPYLQAFAKNRLKSDFGDVRLAKKLGKAIVYSNNACLDGVSQSSFRRWGPEPVCDVCVWRDVPSVCSDDGNLRWGENRNRLTDFQTLWGGNRADFNLGSNVHEVPQFYCLDPEFWDPDIEVPTDMRVDVARDAVKIYHAVGNFDLRTSSRGNIKSSHIYLPLIENLKKDGYPVELMFAKGIPNEAVRFLQVQADIVVDMLTFGWFGANGREALMLGKPLVCYIRPEWLETVAQEVPDYAAELPVVSATPQTVRDVLIELITHPTKRAEIGAKSRAFALKWHSAKAGASRLAEIYEDLLQNKSGGVEPLG